MKKKSISARIGKETVQEIDSLVEELDLNQTDLLVYAISLLYKSVQKQKEESSPFDLLEDLGLIGCFEGDPHLSKNYKSEISDILTEKHGKNSLKKTLC